MHTHKHVEIFTDGACRGNPGPGGWGALLRYQKTEKKLHGAEADTTNNRMELTAAIMGLRALKQRSKVDLTTDSQYVRKGITEWVHTWQRNGWKNSQKKAVKNADLWRLLVIETQKHDITWHWIKGHSGHVDNDLADELANMAIDTLLNTP